MSGKLKIESLNGHTKIPKEVHITKSCTKSTSDGAKVEVTPDFYELEGKLAL